MKKLFTLLTLLVFLGGGKSWGDEYTTIYSFAISKSLARATVHTATGGSFYTTKAGESSSAAIKMDFNNDESNYVKIALFDNSTEPETPITLAEDDIIRVTMYQNSTSKPGDNYGVGIKLTADGEDVTTLTIPTANGKSSASYTYTVTGTSTLKGKSEFYLGRYNGKSVYLEKVEVIHAKTATSEALKSSAAVKVDDTALTLDAGSNGYGVSGTIITLSNNITAISTPDNVELVKTITYDDASTSDADVAVTFDGTVNAGYFIGTATIGLTGSETEYTVRVKQNVTPTLVLSTASGSLNLKSYETGTAKVTLTGANLANGTFTAPTASGVTVTPATVEITDGTIDKEFTITPSATTAAETVLAFAYTGATTQNYTLNYSKTAQRTLTKTNVTEATTWDWSKAYNEDVQLSGTTSPTKSEEFLLSNLAEVKNDEHFNAQALSVICEYATRKQGDVYMLQGNKVAFTTTVPGIIKVTFSNTGNRSDDADGNRYLYVNGENTGVSSYQSSSTKEAVAYVAAGEVVLTAKTGNDEATMIRFIKIEFETLADADAVTVTDAGYATFVLTQDAYFDATPGVTAYAAKVNGEVIDLNEVKAAPAGTPLVIKAAAGTYTLKKATSISPAAVSTDINDLEAGSVTGDGKSHYVLGKEGSTVGFGLLANSVVLPATKAYIPASKFSSAPSRAFYEIDIDGISTGINMVNGEGLKVNGSETYYDLSGRRVLYPTKGLYIVNGKKVVIK